MPTSDPPIPWREKLETLPSVKLIGAAEEDDVPIAVIKPNVPIRMNLFMATFLASLSLSMVWFEATLTLIIEYSLLASRWRTTSSDAPRRSIQNIFAKMGIFRRKLDTREFGCDGLICQPAHIAVPT